MKPVFHKLKITEIEKQTADCCSITFDVPKQLSADYLFRSGQYLTLKALINDADVRRSYSICSSPHEQKMSVAVKHIEGGLFSTYANTVLKSGDELEVMTPMGNFCPDIQTHNKKHYLLFAVGSGITPIISIIKDVLKNEPQSTISLFYGNRNTKSVIFKEEIEALKNSYMLRFKVFFILSQEFMDAPIMNGRIDREKCDEIFTKIIDLNQVDDCFICGPESMIFQVKESMIDNGFESEKIHFELFTSPLGKLDGNKKVERKIDNDKLTNIELILDGQTYAFDTVTHSENILDAALKVGADLPYACKGGVCCTCKAKLLKGEVDMLVNYALEPEEVEAGYILTCQSFPKTEKIIVDFDAL